MPAPPRRHVGQYVTSGDWSDYWTTRISRAESGKIRVRGYPIEELIEHLSYSRGRLSTVARGDSPTSASGRSSTSHCAAGWINSSSARPLVRRAIRPPHFPTRQFPRSASGILAMLGRSRRSPQEPAEMLIESPRLGTADRRGGPRAPSDTWLERRAAVPGFGPSDAQAGRAAGGDAAATRESVLKGWGEHGRLLDAIESELERRKGRPIPINLAGALGAQLADLGFDPLAIGGIGALGYGMALLAHIVEEVREGVPLRIIPDALGARYAGPDDRELPDELKKRRRP